jgi:phosphopantothenoylcysteine decarboxylase / phosphopantothenate---cysteine ligase
VFTDLFDRQDEQDVGHIRLAREADLIVVAPATADLMAKLALGLAGDLASAVLLATVSPVLMAPAMNPAMWSHPATRRNHAQLQADGVRFVGPNRGEMAERGEAGEGRMAEPLEIVAAIDAALGGGPLADRHVLVTSGPTHEPIDPVRYIANRSSGAQGTALAAALRDLGARVTFVTGPASVPPPAGVDIIRVETAREMAAAVEAALPADAAVMAAAVADWRVANAAARKMKKDGSGRAPALEFAENPDILATVSKGAKRPRLVVGFAAETDDVVTHAMAKRARKGCDWIVANDVSPATGIMGGSENAITLISAAGAEPWPRMGKDEVARKLAARIAEALR